MAKRATAKDIRNIAIVAKKRNYNRQLPESVVVALNPDGLNVIGSGFLHGDESHIRCKMYLNLYGANRDANGDLIPWEGLIDVPLDIYNKLPEIG